MKHALTTLVLLFCTLVLTGSTAPGVSPAPARIDGVAGENDELASPDERESRDDEVPLACCKVCSAGKACGDSCISRSKQCHKGQGCACDG